MDCLRLHGGAHVDLTPHATNAAVSQMSVAPYVALLCISGHSRHHRQLGGPAVSAKAWPGPRDATPAPADSNTVHDEW